jgi:hypothetical protein
MAKKRASKWNIHVRNVARVCKSRGIPHKFAMKIAAKSYNKATGQVASNWKALVKRGAGGVAKHRKGSKKSKRRGGSNLDSFAGLDNFLSRLVGGVQRIVSPRLRPSESLAQRKAKLAALISKMDGGIAALKAREQQEDMSRAQYAAHLAELRKLVAAQNSLKKAWREAHKKGAFTGPGDIGGFMASGDPSRRKKKRKAAKRKAPKRRASKSGSARKRTSGKRRVSAATRARMSRAAKRRWAAKRAGKRTGRKTAHRKSPKRKGAKRKTKRKSKRDWSGDFGSF